MKRYLRATTFEELGELETGSYQGVVFGAEFCAKLLEPLSKVREARKLAGELGIDFVLVTPLTVEEDFERVALWLEGAFEPGGEWIANDFGLLRYAHRLGLRGRVGGGRLLSRQQRGQGIKGLLAGADERRRELLTGSLWDDPLTVELLRGLGVTGFELDAVEWGFKRPGALEGLSLSLAGPWCAVTWSPWCFFAQDGSCPCRSGGAGALRLESEREGAPLYTLGNTVFTRTDEETAVKVAMEAGAERLIWSPGIPG